jgi:hypothetical protein
MVYREIVDGGRIRLSRVLYFRSGSRLPRSLQLLSSPVSFLSLSSANSIPWSYYIAHVMEKNTAAAAASKSHKKSKKGKKFLEAKVCT